MTCRSGLTLDMTFCFHSSMTNFWAWRSWVAICLMIASAFLLTLLITRVFYFVFNFLVILRLVPLTNPRFDLLFFSVLVFCWLAIFLPKYRALFSGFFDDMVVASIVLVTQNKSYTSFMKFLYSSIIKLLYIQLLIKLLFGRSKNNIVLDNIVRYTINNLVPCNQSLVDISSRVP